MRSSQTKITKPRPSVSKGLAAINQSGRPHSSETGHPRDFDHVKIPYVALGCIAIAFLFCFVTGHDLNPGQHALRNLTICILVFKALTFFERKNLPLTYFLWIGMNPHEFMAPAPDKKEQRAEFIRSCAEIIVGFGLVATAQIMRHEWPAFIIGWMKLCGLSCLIYFGIFRMLTFVWQKNGRGVQALMREPLSAVNLPEFWGKRWNRAFPFVMHLYIHDPVKKYFSGTAALFAVFLVSGILHEAIVSVPVGRGYGLPILYFMIQFAGFQLMNSEWGKKKNLQTGLLARTFTLLWVSIPLPLLFHHAFIVDVMAPIMHQV